MRIAFLWIVISCWFIRWNVKTLIVMIGLIRLVVIGDDVGGCQSGRVSVRSSHRPASSCVVTLCTLTCSDYHCQDENSWRP